MIYCDFQVSRRSAQLMEESKEFQLIIDITEKKLDQNSRRKYLRWFESPAQYRYSMEEFHISTVRAGIHTNFNRLMLLSYENSDSADTVIEAAIEIATLAAKLKDCDTDLQAILKLLEESIKGMEKCHSDKEKCQIDMENCLNDMQELKKN